MNEFTRPDAPVHQQDVRPATRIGREIIFDGGEARRLGLLEYLLIKVGVKRTVARATRREA